MIAAGQPSLSVVCPSAADEFGCRSRSCPDLTGEIVEAALAPDADIVALSNMRP
jgi:hypothetical protein